MTRSQSAPASRLGLRPRRTAPPVSHILLVNVTRVSARPEPGDLGPSPGAASARRRGPRLQPQQQPAPPRGPGRWGGGVGGVHQLYGTCATPTPHEYASHSVPRRPQRPPGHTGRPRRAHRRPRSALRPAGPATGLPGLKAGQASESLQVRADV